MPFYDVFERNRGSFAAADPTEGAFGEVEVFEFVEVLEEGFPDIKGLGAPGAPGKFLEALFDRFGKADGQH
jgi:hypothetical protein